MRNYWGLWELSIHSTSNSLFTILEEQELWNVGDGIEEYVFLWDVWEKESWWSKKTFENKTLNTYKLLEIEERGCGMSKVVVNVTWDSNGEEKNGDLVFGVSYVSLN